MHRNDNVTLPSWRQRLPDSLRNFHSLRKLRLNSVDVYLLGTAHVSNDSCAHVSDLLGHVQPDAIMVELCEGRLNLLTGNEDNETNVDSTEEDKSSRWQALSTNLLTKVQEDYAETLGVELGGEFRVAHDYWLSQTCHLILGDRPVQITLMRAWESLWWWPRLKLVIGLLWSSVFKPSKKEIREWLAKIMASEHSDVLTESLEELRRGFPTLYATIISERDAYLAAKICQSCHCLATQGARQLVAIVGSGHVPGIVQWLVNATNITPEDILKPLVETKKWENDEQVQGRLVPMWIKEVTLLQGPSS